MEGGLINNCSFAGITPVMVELPYPPVRVKERNRTYAELISVDYCGMVSELTATIQYINNENRLSCERCPLAKTLLGMGIAEMIHMQRLGELIILLGGRLDFACRHTDGRQVLWTPEYLNIPENAAGMLLADLEAERATIRQYEMHISMIEDEYVNDLLLRIIRDEEYHIELLRALRNEL